jgi:hypothetical protein
MAPTGLEVVVKFLSHYRKQERKQERLMEVMIKS